MNAMKEDETPVSSAGSEHPSTKSFQSTDPPPADIPTTTTNVASVSTDKILGIPSTVHSSQALGFANTITTNLLSSSSTTDTAETNAALTNTEQSVDRNTTLCTVTGMMDVTTAIVDKVQADTDIDLTTINTVTTISNTTTTISNTTTTISNTLTVTVDSEASQTKRDTAVAGTAPVMLISEETVTVTIPSAKEVAPVTIPTPGDRDPVTMLTAGERIPVTISSSREAASVTIPTAGEMTPVTVPLTGEAASATQAATHTPQITNAKELTIYTAPLSTNTVIKMKEASHTVPTYIDEASVMPLLLTSAAHTSPFPSSSHQAPQTSCTSVEQDDPMEYHNTPQTSKEQGTASTSRNALQLLTSYGISDSEDEECSVDESMDTSCDIGQNETELTNGTAENVATNVCSELPFEGSVPPHSLQLPMPLVEGQCSMPVISEKTFNGGAGTGERESKEAGDLDVVMTGSYRHTVDVGSDTEDSESDSVSSSLVCDISAVERIDSTSEESTNEESSSEESATDSKEVEAILQRKKHQVQKKPASKLNILVTPGELQLHELPPIEDLHISVPEEKAVPIGTVFNTVEQQVVVEAFAKIPAIDLDSVLFLDHGKRTLGQVFDVFGPVQEPFYVVRFNSADHIKDNKIEKGDIVYFAPSTEHTNFIVIDELMRLKGSDASGLTGNELPASECQEFSDDEEEARVLGGKKQNKYTTSTNEFQSCRKRGKGQVHGEARDRGHTHENGNNIPFHGRGKVSRPPTRFGYPPAMHPRFRPRGPPPFSMGPPDFIPGSPGFQGPSRMHRNPEPHDPRPFSNFQNRVEMTADQGMALITMKVMDITMVLPLAQLLGLSRQTFSLGDLHSSPVPGGISIPVV
nr:uncharacterized protein LOC128698799 [Cherax quadricarinatus]XP_053647166.1 uncharacterized protein LOC128698799 [Cherax quadricarinatus]